MPAWTDTSPNHCTRRSSTTTRPMGKKTIQAGQSIPQYIPLACILIECPSYKPAGLFAGVEHGRRDAYETLKVFIRWRMFCNGLQLMDDRYLAKKYYLRLETCLRSSTTSSDYSIAMSMPLNRSLSKYSPLYPKVLD